PARGRLRAAGSCRSGDRQGRGLMTRRQTGLSRPALLAVAAVAALLVVGIAAAAGGNARLTNDCHATPTDKTAGAACGAGYVSDYTLATGRPYTDRTLDECTRSPSTRGTRPCCSEARTTTAACTTRATRAASRCPPDRSGSATTARRTPARTG